MSVLSTPRLVLRRWRDSDRQPFAAMNADPRVMEFFPHRLSRWESDAMADRIDAHFAEHGFGLYAAELKATQQFIGYIGLAVPRFTAPFTPCVEIGWRLAAEYWEQGLATEGALKVMSYAFDELNLNSLVSFTVPQNRRSIRVMEKIGMVHEPAESFDHPGLPAGDPLRPHSLYCLQKADWEANKR